MDSYTLDLFVSDIHSSICVPFFHSLYFGSSSSPVSFTGEYVKVQIRLPCVFYMGMI